MSCSARTYVQITSFLFLQSCLSICTHYNFPWEYLLTFMAEVPCLIGVNDTRPKIRFGAPPSTSLGTRRNDFHFWTQMFLELHVIKHILLDCKESATLNIILVWQTNCHEALHFYTKTCFMAFKKGKRTSTVTRLKAGFIPSSWRVARLLVNSSQERTKSFCLLSL